MGYLIGFCLPSFILFIIAILCSKHSKGLAYALIILGLLVTGLSNVGLAKKGASFAPLIFDFIVGWVVFLGCTSRNNSSKAENSAVNEDVVSADILLQYKELLDLGVITREEFDRVKNTFLETGKIAPPDRNLPGTSGYKCTACGAIRSSWYNVCPECGANNTMVKYDTDTRSVSPVVTLSKRKELLDIGAITQEEFDELSSASNAVEYKYKCTACGALRTGWYDTCPECGAKNKMIRMGNSEVVKLGNGAGANYSIEVLLKFKELLDAGAITQEEFETIDMNLHVTGKIFASAEE